MEKTFTLPVEFDDELGHFITLPQEILDHTGWKTGDELIWTQISDSAFELKKKDDEQTKEQ